MTYRERRERKVERLREWASKREATATATIDHINDTYRGDYAFNTQPGHIPARARVIAQQDRAFESLRKAQSMDSRADGIESQLSASIYDDDPDAIERLTERIAGLEAQRERLKQFNASARKGQPDWALLTDDEARRAKDGVRFFGSKLAYPLTNLGADIRRNQERLERLQKEHAA